MDEPIAAAADAPLRQRLAWVAYDWANSGYGLIIVGPLFQYVLLSHLLPPLSEPAGDAVRGLRVMGQALPGMAVFALLTSMASLLVVLSAPVLGAIADLRGWTKGLLIAHATAGSLGTMTLLFAREGQWAHPAIVYVLSSYCFGASLTFYNAYLPRLAGPGRQGRLSGWGFAAGYIGGAVALIVANEMPWRYGIAFAGVWWLLFSLPAFLLLPTLPPSAEDAPRGPIVIAGFRRVVGTFRNLRRYRTLFVFLLAFLIYNNGVDTAINISPAFGAEVLKMSQAQLTWMFLTVQFVAFGGAIVMGHVADRFGNKPVILSNLVIWCLAVACVFAVQTAQQYLALGVIIGLVIGGVQSSSRALMARLAPEHIRNEAFGFFSLSGKAVSVLGPVLLAFFATYFESRASVLAVLPFLVVGLLIMLTVREPPAAAAPTDREAAPPAP